MGAATPNSRGRIGINAHLLSGRPGYRRAGIHHYIAHLLGYLPQSDGRFHYVIFAHGSASLPAGPATTIVRSRWPTELRTIRIAWEQLALPWAVARRRLDLLHSLAFVTPVLSPVPTVVTVFDLSFVHYPERFPRLQRRYLSSQTRRSCLSARRVVAISSSGRQDVHRFFGVPLERIDVVRPGVSPIFRPLPAAQVEAFRRREGLPEKFILHVGTLQPRKNLPLLVQAFAQMNRPGVELVLVGGKGWYFEEIFAAVRRQGLEARVRFAGYVPDADLPLWYNSASVLAFPSVYEGFGLPVVQAMACGTPVVAAETSAIPEVVGEAAFVYRPQDAAALAEHMATVLDDPQVMATMRERGLHQAQNYSWQKAGREMITVYQQALAEK